MSFIPSREMFAALYDQQIEALLAGDFERCARLIGLLVVPTSPYEFWRFGNIEKSLFAFLPQTLEDKGCQLCASTLETNISMCKGDYSSLWDFLLNGSKTSLRAVQVNSSHWNPSRAELEEFKRRQLAARFDFQPELVFNEDE